MPKNLSFLLFPFALVFYEIATYLSNDMYLPALPKIAAEFTVSQQYVQYSLTSWFFGAASTQLLLSPLCKKFGKRKIFMFGIILFIVTSLLCALSQNIDQLILVRFFQGSTVCYIGVIGYALIHERYAGKQAVKITSAMNAVAIIGPGVGPFLGSVFVTYANWQMIFVLLAAWGLVAYIFIFYTMPASKLLRSKKIYIKPIIMDYMEIFKNKEFLKITFCYSLLFACFLIWIIESPFILINGYKLTEMEYGYVQVFIFTASIIASLTNRVIIDLWPIRRIIKGLFISLAILYSIYMLQAYYYDNLTTLIINIFAIFYVNALAMAPLNRLAIEATDKSLTDTTAIISIIQSAIISLTSYILALITSKGFSVISMMGAIYLLIAVIIYNFIEKELEFKTEKL